jgi:hypothetical protein
VIAQLADEAVRRITQSASAREKFGLNIAGSRLILSDWLPYMQSQLWFIQHPERFAENFPLAVGW